MFIAMPKVTRKKTISSSWPPIIIQNNSTNNFRFYALKKEIVYIYIHIYMYTYILGCSEIKKNGILICNSN